MSELAKKKRVPRKGAVPSSKGHGKAMNEKRSLPVYAMVGLRPVKAVRTPEGGTAVFALDWQSGEMKLDASWLAELIGHHDETEFLSEEEFESKLAVARASIKAHSGRTA